jgi:hypothetical protein
MSQSAIYNIPLRGATASSQMPDHFLLNQHVTCAKVGLFSLSVTVLLLPGILGQLPGAESEGLAMRRSVIQHAPCGPS